MDSNGTKFHLLLGKPDWDRAKPGAREWVRRTTRPIASLGELWNRSADDAELTGLRWDSESNVLTLAPQLFQFEPSAKDNPPRLRDRRGAGRDRFGNWYWIAEDEKEILVNSAGSATTTHFWSSAADCAGCDPEPRFGEFAPLNPASAAADLQLRGLAVTEDHYLVVGVLEPAGLLIFDLHAGAGPVQMIWPTEVEFAPFDFAARPGGGVFILDRNPADALKGTRYWVLDRHFNVEARNQSEVELNAAATGPFQPVTGEPRKHQTRMFPRGITLDSASPVAALDAISIEALPDQTVLILDRDEESGFSQIYRYGFEGQLGEPVSTAVVKALITDAARARFRLIAHDFAFVAEHQANGKTVPDRLYVVEEKGNQSFAFLISLRNGQLELEPLQAYLPMRLFGGKGLVAAGDRPWYDFSDRWIPLIEQPRPRFESDATLETPEFDGGEPDCKWHRLMIDGRIPPESKVEVWTRASNDKQDLPFTEWHQEPELYRRRDGSELPFASNRSAAAMNSPAEYATWELLFQRARGRFIQIKLRLSGNVRTTPRLRALRAYYPRFSYLDHYLPAVYREDTQSASFLDRFLANLEGFYTSIEDRIAAVQVLFDFRSAPGDYLDWLAGWIGIVLDPSWGDAKRRLFIQHAMDFFQYRGTIHGLKAALRLAMENCVDESVFDVAHSSNHQRDSIRIIENYRARKTPGIVLGDPTSIGALTGSGLAQVAQTPVWAPANGRSDLYSRYSDYLAARFSAELPSVFTFPLRGYDWQKAKPQIGSSAALTPVTDSTDELLWRAFLEERYVTIEALNLAHATNLSSFAAVVLPSNLVPASAALVDWNDFITEKSAAWRDFSQQVLGFVPRALGNERNRWRDFLVSRYPSVAALSEAYGAAYDDFESVPLPADAPAGAAPRGDWDEFRLATAGTAGAAMRTRWQDFLARRYRRTGALNEAYDTGWKAFAEISLPDTLPLRESAIADWHQFESVVLAMEAAAHRFMVLLPAPKDRDAVEFQQRRELATRIVNWEKPAHTVFDVKFYWAMFRAGAARLGYDTLIDVGSRAPELVSPMVLGQGYLAESYLADGRDLTGRSVLGGDPLKERRQIENASRTG
jgi:phage tail-like protein